MKEKHHYKASPGTLVVALVLAIIHFLAGFAILMVSSWFIAACSVAGLGFNYMLPAVVIRGLAILRIGSGYFSMLVGHSHLLGKLAAIRLNIFKSLRNQVSVSREESLDVLHHQSEDVASIWMSWVGQNAGAFLSLVVLNTTVLTLVPQLSIVALLFSLLFILIYLTLLASMVYRSAELIAVRRRFQFDVIKHIEAAPLWHLYAGYQSQAPTATSLHVVVNALQRQIRHAALLLFVGTMIAITALFSTYSVELSGNALFLILPVALLSVNDWLSPTLGNQQQLLKFFNAKHSIRDVSIRTSAVTTLDDKIMKLKVSDFKATKTQMPSVSASFEPNTTSVLLGGSGVGKSRFLQALSGLLPFEGCRELELESGVFTSQALLFDSFYLEQFPYVLSDTLGENLRVVNREASDSLLLEVLDKVGLGHLSNLNEWLGAHGLPLSGGEKKRLGLARAILSHSQVILIDEPFESLDDKNIEKVTEIINELAEQKIIVLATHILPSSLRYQQCISLKTVSSCQHVPVLLETSS